MLRLPSQAPDWAIRTAARGQAAVPINDVIRSALTVPLVMGAAFAFFGPNVAIFASLSALLVVLSERGGTTGQRLLRSGAGLAAGTFAQLFGPLTGGTGWVPVAAVLAFGLLSGVMSGLGSGLSWAAMQLLVQMAIAGGLQVDLPHRDRVIAYIAGGALALAAMLTQSALEHTDRLYSSALNQAETSLDAWSTSSQGENTENLRAQANADLLAAATLLLVARPIRRKRKAFIGRERARLAHVAARAQFVEAGNPAASPVRPSLIQPISVGSILWGGITATATWEFTLRLECCLTLGELVRQLSPIGHGYWILLTIALVLKPDIQSVFSRTLQRGIGTLLGVSLAWIPTLIAPGYVLFPLIAALSAPIPWAVRRNYGIFCVLVTPLVLLILDFGGPIDFGIVVQRVVNTSIGCFIVLIIGYAAWPTTWHPATRRITRSVATDLTGYVALAPDDTKAAERRLHALMTIHELDDRVSRALSEPLVVRQRLRVLAEVGAAAQSVLIAVAPIRDDCVRRRASARLARLADQHGASLTPTAAEKSGRRWEEAIERLEVASRS